jgi:serine phosphatase RsbU (regulator of sigma subunit)/PAS domain-containing protein
MPAASRPADESPRPSSTSPAGLASEAASVHFELAVDVAGIGRFDWDLRSETLTWDDRLKRLIQVDPAAPPTLATFAAKILPTDLPAVEQATRDAIADLSDLHVDFRIVDDEGAIRWLTASARAVAGADGTASRLLGVVYDSSRVHDDREQAARALDTMATAYAMVDRDWTIRYLNQAARRLIDRGTEPVGLSIWEIVPGLDHASISTLLRSAMDGRQATTLELPMATSSGIRYEISVQPVANGIAVLVSDVTTRRAAQEEAARTADRLALLAQAGSTLVQRRPLVDTIEAGLDLLVPRLAVSATICLRQSAARGLTLMRTRHSDPQVQTDLQALFQRLAPRAEDPRTASGRAILSGKTEIVGRIDDRLLSAVADDPALRDRLWQLRDIGIIAVPMISRGESIGLIWLLGRAGETAAEPDFVLIEDIAARIASAIDNAQILVQVQQARQTAELATHRLEILASVADALGSTLDADQASARLSRMLVPGLATFSLVTLLDDDGAVEHIYAAHEDPRRQALLEQYAQARRQSLAVDGALLDEVVDVSRPMFKLGGDEFADRLRCDPAAGALRELAPGFVTALPILARDQALGVMSLYTSAERGPLTEIDLTSAREVARRAGLVLDNARLYARSQSVAVTLQRSLLTEAVSQGDLAVEVRYEPAIADAQIGGDWYDAFNSGNGSTTLVIGDVMGHDIDAAALMGQLRTMVRTIAVDRHEAPSAVLRRVDAAAQALDVDTTATAVLAQITGGGAERGRRLRWSNAGHPSPVVLSPSGQARVLSTPADLLLGFGAGSVRTDHEIDLPVGSTVLMFTDGLVESRVLPIDLGLARLAEVAGPLSHLPLPLLCDALLTALVPPAGAEDDIALVAVRVLPPPACR